jgi:glycerol-3-phosphate cytidylyltransferase
MAAILQSNTKSVAPFVDAKPLRIGIIAGAFDIIHPGYILAFQEAKLHCSHLVVCLHIDPSIENGKPKPVLSCKERKLILESIRYVNYVMPYTTEADFLAILKHVDPDIRFLGSDYSIGVKAITGSELNIPIYYLDRSHGWSATKLKNLICESMEKP